MSQGGLGNYFTRFQSHQLILLHRHLCLLHKKDKTLFHIGMNPSHDECPVNFYNECNELYILVSISLSPITSFHKFSNDFFLPFSVTNGIVCSTSFF